MMPRYKEEKRYKIADDIEWKAASPRSSTYYIEVRDHELLFIWTKGRDFSTITLIHTWQDRQTTTRVVCKGKTIAACMNELTNSRGFLWRTITFHALPGRSCPKDMKPPKIMHFGQPAVGRKKGYKASEKTKSKIAEAQTLRWARVKRNERDLRQKIDKVRGKALFSRSMVEVPDDE